MEIIIKGEPKEIAALELELKDGNKEIAIQPINVSKEDAEKFIESFKDAPVECPRKWN